MSSYPKIYIYQRLVLAKLYIDAHFSENINLDNICNNAFFSKFHFIRLFKKIYNKTPHQYLTAVRIENAKRLLEHGFSITDCCFRTGYESAGSFSELFKRSTGVTPTQYQLSYLARQQEIKERPLDFIPNCFAEKNEWN